MALLFIDSFDHYNIGSITRKWNAPALTDTSSGAIGTGRYGTGNYKVTGAQKSVMKVLGTSTTLIAGFAFKGTGSMSISAAIILRFYDAGTAQVELRVNADLTLSFTRGATTLGTSTVALNAGVWSYLECKCTFHNTAGVVEVRQNGTAIIGPLTNQNTRSTSNNSANSLAIGFVSAGSGAFGTSGEFDDFYVCDDTGGSPQNTFLGDVRIDALAPSGNGAHSDWTASSGANYTDVDEQPENDDTDYVFSNTVNNVDTYAFNDMVSPSATIYGEQLNLQVRKTDGGLRGAAPVTRQSSTDYVGSTSNVAESYYDIREIRVLDPATNLAWTDAGINSAEFGIKLIT
jgi:hypothetical protein